MDQGSNKNHSPAYNFAPTVTKFCVMWEGLSLPHDTKFGNCRCKIVDSRSFPSWSLIHGLRWSGLIKVGPGLPTSKICFPYFVEKMSVFLITFPYPLICSSSDSKQSLWQLFIYSGGTHWLPVETLVDSFGTTGTGSEEEHVLLPHVEERRMNVLVIKEAFEGFKA